MMKDWKFCTVIVDQNDIVYSVQPRDTYVINAGDAYNKYKVFKKLQEDGWELSDSHTELTQNCLLYTSPSPRDATLSRMPSSA